MVPAPVLEFWARFDLKYHLADQHLTPCSPDLLLLGIAQLHANHREVQDAATYVQECALPALRMVALSFLLTLRSYSQADRDAHSAVKKSHVHFFFRLDWGRSAEPNGGLHSELNFNYIRADALLCQDAVRYWTATCIAHAEGLQSESTSLGEIPTWVRFVNILSGIADVLLLDSWMRVETHDDDASTRMFGDGRDYDETKDTCRNFVNTEWHSLFSQALGSLMRFITSSDAAVGSSIISMCANSGLFSGIIRGLSASWQNELYNDSFYFLGKNLYREGHYDQVIFTRSPYLHTINFVLNAVEDRDRYKQTEACDDHDGLYGHYNVLRAAASSHLMRDSEYVGEVIHILRCAFCPGFLVPSEGSLGYKYTSTNFSEIVTETKKMVSDNTLPLTLTLTLTLHPYPYP